MLRMNTAWRTNRCGTPVGAAMLEHVPPNLRMLVSRCAAGVVVGCLAFAMRAAPLHAISIDPNVDFTAHLEHQGLVVDQAPHGAPAVLVPAGWLFSSGPNFLLQADGKTLAAFWVKDAAHVTVRRSADPDSPVIGQVEATWQQGAIRLKLEPADGPAIQTGRFHRVDGFGVPQVLSSPVNTVVELRGMYLAKLRDPKGDAAGWMRVRISPYQGSRRIFDADLPASVQEPLAMAAVVLVNSDVSYIRSHALDVNLGN